MKARYIFIILIIFAWPLFYLYQRQLGAVSFLLLAMFFLFIAIKEMKKLKDEEKNIDSQQNKQKIKRNSR
nr:hypothetical protein [Neobacillus sp. Marseille-Q6967]